MLKYLVIGSGRWAHHLLKTLALAGIPSENWARKTHSEADLQHSLLTATHVWLAISDHALPEWAQKLSAPDRLILHSSGALEIPNAHSVHPLMSFTSQLYPDDFYSKFAFVTTSELSKEALIANFKNPFYKISVQQKAFYHALCVLAGNGSALLWQKFFKEMRALGIGEPAAQLYMQRISENLVSFPDSALTGPLVRNDQKTLQKNLESLSQDPFQEVLIALMHAYQGNQRGAL